MNRSPCTATAPRSRDFTYVGTVTEVIVDAITRGVTHDTPVNLAFGSRTNLFEVIDNLSGLIGGPLEVDHVDNRPGDVPHSQADNTLLRSLFPEVEPVPLDEGLVATVGWMRGSLAESAEAR